MAIQLETKTYSIKKQDGLYSFDGSAQVNAIGKIQNMYLQISKDSVSVGSSSYSEMEDGNQNYNYSLKESDKCEIITAIDVIVADLKSII